MNLPISAPPVSGKHPLRSKTLWFNVFALLMGLLEIHSGLLQSVLPPKVYVVVALIVPIVNLILRALTRQGLALEKRP